MPSDPANPIALPKRRKLSTATPLELSACEFVAALAQNVDSKRGVKTGNGTRETRAGIAAIVKKQCFDGR